MLAADDLRTEFRGIAMVLKMVTAANNSGRSTLIPSQGDCLPPVRSMLSQANVMNSLASILDRNSEVVAVVSVCPQTGQNPVWEFIVLAPEGRDRVPEKERSNGQSVAWVEQRSHACSGKACEGVKKEGDISNGARAITGSYRWRRPLTKCSLPTIFDIGNVSHNESIFEPDPLVTIVETGQSHWPTISKLIYSSNILDPEILKLPGNDPLENHVATITDFINAYRLERNDDKRIDLFWHFSKYLSRVSWLKTYRRLRNWTSKGFIHALIMYPLDLLQSPSQNPNPKRSNEGLYCEILGLHEEEDAIKILMNHLALFELPSSHLKPSNLQELMKALQKEEGEGFESGSAYNGKSSIQFHCLIIALFIAYIKALQECFDIQQGKDETKDKAKDKAKESLGGLRDIHNRIWKYGRILWTVTSSRMFDDYLHTLQGTLMSVYPVQISAYTKYFEGLGLGDKQSDSLDGKVAGQCELRDRDSNLDEDVGSKEDVEEEQMRELNLQTSDAKPVARFKSWMSTITSDFQALRNVLKDAIKSPQFFGSHFIEAKRFSTPGSIMLNWHDAILNLCCPDGEPQPQATATFSGDLDAVSPEVMANDSSPHPTSCEQSESLENTTYITMDQAMKAINLLQQRIDLDRKTLNAFGASSGLASPSEDNTSLLETGDEKKNFPIAAGMVVWTGREHAEGIAGSVFRHPDCAIRQSQAELRKLILSCNSQEISVSRLCCPTCWELLQIQGFRMQGFHTSFYPVELPSCLSEPELKEMVTRFRGHLRRELITFIEDKSTMVLHKPSESRSTFQSDGSQSSLYRRNHRKPNRPP